MLFFYFFLDSAAHPDPIIVFIMYDGNINLKQWQFL